MPTPLRIAVVEDQADARTMLRLLLESRGHQVFEAPDGWTAVELIGTERPDVALIDIGLPSIDGHEVARRVRKALGQTQIMLVALTGYGADEDVSAAREAGFDHHLTKPTDPETLVALLARAGAER